MDTAAKINWSVTPGSFRAQAYVCAHCSSQVFPVLAFVGDVIAPNSTFHNQTVTHARQAWVLTCPVCTRPTYLNDFEKIQIPSVRLGATLTKLPEIVRTAYDEARDCSSVGAFTATVMIARKILMHVAVEEGAAKDLKFFQYVDYLKEGGFVPPKGHDWVKRIKDRGNEANHELPAISQSDAEDIMHLVEMLLRFNYQMP